MSRHRQAGLTLIEIMIAVAILALISAIAIPLYQGYIGEARFGTAAKDISQAQLILDDLAADNSLGALDGGSTDQFGLYMRDGRLELGDPSSTPAGTEPWLDPWDRIYRYQRPVSTSQNYLLFSQGENAGDTSDDVNKH